MTIWQPELSRFEGPRYQALAAAIAEAVSEGALEAGARLPTHRALAERLGVTVGTVTRGYAEAERRGLVDARVGSGTYVREPRSRSAWSFAIPEREPPGGIVDFGLALPVPAQRERMLADALRSLAQDPDGLHQALLYLPETGLPRHRETLTRWLADWGVRLDAQEVIITLGGLHALNVALEALARPGELIASAALTYPGLIAATRRLGLRHVGLPLDVEGIVPEALERLCLQQSPRALYCVPNQNNPTTAVMSRPRREALLAVARRHRAMIIEDDVHLVEASERPANLVDLDAEQVLYLTGCSKILAGGLRVGVLRAPGAWLARAGEVLRSHCWMPPPLNAELACRWIESGAAAELGRWQRAEIAARQALVAETFAGLDFSAQPYGFNVWLRLPEAFRAVEFARRCEAAGVFVKTAEPFAVGGVSVPQAVRLSISAPARRDDVARGLGLVRQVLEEGPAPAAATV